MSRLAFHMPTEQQLLRILSGEARGIGPTLARAGLRLAEPLYATAMRLRNVAFERGWRKVHRLPLDTVSVGNLTTGGTGKTPVVRWLAERLRDAGRRPAILMRGYTVGDATVSDEQLMLEEQLHRGNHRRVIVHADPDRVAGAQAVVRHDPDADLFILDDGLQHRRAGRDFDLVLVSATNPFGYGHVLPRGLLREPLSGLKRADAVLITRADQIEDLARGRIKQTIRQYNPDVPIYCARHVLTGVLLDNEAEITLRRDAPTLRLQGVRSPDAHPPEAFAALGKLATPTVFAFAGIGDPAGLSAQLRLFAAHYAGEHWFGDHHAYSAADLAMLDAKARDAGANLLLTTEKDWAKIRHLDRSSLATPIGRVAMAIRFMEDDEARLLEQIMQAL